MPKPKEEQKERLKNHEGRKGREGGEQKNRRGVGKPSGA